MGKCTITLSLPSALVARLKGVAAERETSVSALLIASLDSACESLDTGVRLCPGDFAADHHHEGIEIRSLFVEGQH